MRFSGLVQPFHGRRTTRDGRRFHPPRDGVLPRPASAGACARGACRRDVNCLFPNATGGRLGGTDLTERPDAAWLVEAGARAKALGGGATADYVTPLAVYLASRACDTSQNMYSALGGRYARIFVGLTRGWTAPGAQAPSVEDSVDHLAQIDDRTQYDVPLSGLDEMDTVIAAKTALGLP
ncbi:hypothetical protein [Streptomyces sp. SAS_270]|uniref:hypothetical protein n=1 Tax=Streptomyces sp. SAS_270 TaxID=3412748 RepID=UPI00403CED13